MLTRMLAHVVVPLRLAVAFLTRIPNAHPPRAGQHHFGWAHAFFPAVGALIGLLVASVQIAASALGMSGLAASGLGLAAGALLTGCLHEDGLADTADGLGGGHDRHRKLEIMRDSRVGTYGAAALILAMIVKVGSISQAHGWTLVVALAVAHSLSRSAATVVAKWLPPARLDGLGATAGRIPLLAITVSLLSSLAIGAALLDVLRLSASIIATCIAAGTMALLAKRQIGGQTGDILGAVQQLAEIALLLVLTAGATP